MNKIYLILGAAGLSLTAHSSFGAARMFYQQQALTAMLSDSNVRRNFHVTQAIDSIQINDLKFEISSHYFDYTTRKTKVCNLQVEMKPASNDPWSAEYETAFIGKPDCHERLTDEKK